MSRNAIRYYDRAGVLCVANASSILSNDTARAVLTEQVSKSLEHERVRLIGDTQGFHEHILRVTDQAALEAACAAANVEVLPAL